MAKASQSAIARYKARRRGEELPTGPAAPAARQPRRLRLVLITALAAVLGGVLALRLVRGPESLQLDYMIDLTEAPRGSLTLTIDITGRMPRYLDLDLPTGMPRVPGEQPHSPTAYERHADDAPGRTLALERHDDGWRLHTRGVRRATFAYRIDLSRADGQDEDIRHHISTLVNGGVRAAGFEIFLIPRNAPVGDITVRLRNPRNLPVLAPWPTLIEAPHRDMAAPDSVSLAHLGTGQSYLPAGDRSVRPVPARSDPVVPGTVHLYHPRNLDDLNNSLLVCGNLRIATTEARDCVIQYATDRNWNFADDEALDLVRRIARTELGFFGSAPGPSITVLLAANEITAAGGFDVYGVHTGSSVLVMIDRETTWGELEDHAASVIAHEMFHGWLGDAIPQENPETMWFTEGATTWYAARMLTAAGVWSPDHARKVLRARLHWDYERNELLGVMSVADAAAEVMAAPTQIRFAYAGGVTACAALDVWLARHSDIDRPLDGVLRHLYDHRDGSPLTRASLEDAILQVTGVPCGEWLDRHVYGKTALPVPDELI